ncbi:Glycine-rich family protein, putative isoform 2 [Hibiscus syriacus]|uniref:Glycine-rich family protein, putative isoform 2 n=1 Tax=Hibiscus syriacus TaxID=106335 RepID=A0A6A3AVQ3_HIBSY|nr:Glycine-rich family protein, putative isoform 2 [Hibiscus syriacus]
MASLFTIKSWFFAVTIVSLSILVFQLGKADEYEDMPETGRGSVVGEDPAQIVAKALLCFNDKYIYSSCEESYRLTANGNLDVPLRQRLGISKTPSKQAVAKVLKEAISTLRSALKLRRTAQARQLRAFCLGWGRLL